MGASSREAWQKFPSSDWAAVREDIVAPWPRAFIEHDLRFWADEIRWRGRRLPSSRVLARTWGVSQTTAIRLIRACPAPDSPVTHDDSQVTHQRLTRPPSNADNPAVVTHRRLTPDSGLRETKVQPSVSRPLRQKKEDIEPPPYPPLQGGDVGQVEQLVALLAELPEGPVFDRYAAADPAAVEKVCDILKAWKKAGKYHGSLRRRTMAQSLVEAARQVREARAP